MSFATLLFGTEEWTWNDMLTAADASFCILFRKQSGLWESTTKTTSSGAEI